jgi:type IV pilus assembly protein PilE
MRKAEGFTLIELMIVLVIVAALLLIALPAYQNSVIKSNRAAGKGILLDIAARQEQYFINNKIYSDELDKLGYDVDGADAFYVNNQVEKSNAAAGDSVYKIQVVLLSTLTYSITATPLTRQLKDVMCKAFTITSEGVRSSSGTASSSECW